MSALLRSKSDRVFKIPPFSRHFPDTSEQKRELARLLL